MVLMPRAPALLLAFSSLAAFASSACKDQSLFDEVKDPGGPGDVGVECPANCLGDAARDFNGGNGGAGERWRYLEDLRDRSWTEMTIVDGSAQGAEPSTSITTCAARPTAPACAEIPGALLLSAAGSGAASDPALEFRPQSKGTFQVGLRVFVPATAISQQLLVYRNSREDLLFSGPAAPGELFERAIFADLLSDDRLLVALAPVSGGAADVALELFVSDIGMPSRCQLAVPFEQTSGTTVTSQCGGAFTSFDYANGDVEIAPTLTDGPYPELGQAARIAPGYYLKGDDILDKTGDVTLQFWMRFDAVFDSYGAWPVSDLDLDTGGGIGTSVYTAAELRFDSTVGTTDGSYLGANAPFSRMGQWVFVRVVHAEGKVSTCLDGKPFSSFELAAGKLASGYPLYLGRNVLWSPQVAAFDGRLDDLRVLSAALPCQ